ncbi:hypothetical protein BCR32DRAFT_324936 [Anaeromyces robustus]|uniref:Metallo-beta-lactamase domain-containing protein n=1 Tax=Anaeromyces robustus TaxID=1754192 RepID=A0A1Y1XM03_9FUNG|nr:hypothetical protein BCR32DRAFT_324936 [Anaeromyces robustus]|eukprot:ORX86546.1 hypothetical protein BCR32DRAFT_324936 [Anaeromyces robustus]
MFNLIIKFLLILNGLSAINSSIANPLLNVDYYSNVYQFEPLSYGLQVNNNANVQTNNNGNAAVTTFRRSWIYSPSSNLCATYVRPGYKLRLRACSENNPNQQWYIPSDSSNYWILAPTISFYENNNTKDQFQVANNAIQQYFNGNTICGFIDNNKNFASSNCINGTTLQATKMDPVNYSISQNVIKSSVADGGLCLDVFSEDVEEYKLHKKQIQYSQNYGINPNTLEPRDLRITMKSCQQASQDSTQYWSFFLNYSDLVSFQNFNYNPNNYPGITKVTSNQQNIYIGVKESKNLNLDIYAGDVKLTNYPNVSFMVDDETIAKVTSNNQAGLKVRALKKTPSGATVVGVSPGATTLTVKVHDKQIQFSIVVGNTGDKMAFLDIQTYDTYIGDCIIVQSTNESGQPIYAMIDTGGGGAVSLDKIMEYIHDNNITIFEWILITHFHGDHYGGLSKILSKGGQTKAVYMKEYHGNDSNYDKVKHKNVADYRSRRMVDWNNLLNFLKERNIPVNYIAPKQNENLSLGNYHFKFYNLVDNYDGYTDVCAQFQSCNENTNSVVAMVENNKKYYYLTGDIDTYTVAFSKSKDKKLQNAYNSIKVDRWVKESMKDANIDHIDVYKISHHGVLYNNIPSTFTLAKANVYIASTEKTHLRNRATILEKRAKSSNPKAQYYYTGSGIVTVSQARNGNISIVQSPDEHGEILKK